LRLRGLGRGLVAKTSSVEDTISILRGPRERFEVHRGVKILDSAFVAAATQAPRRGPVSPLGLELAGVDRERRALRILDDAKLGDADVDRPRKL